MTAQDLLDLHVPGTPLVLPNIWDADTARLVVAAGFPAVATSSVAVAGTLGYGDGEEATAAEMFAAAARITAAVDVPVTVDAESGYGLPPGALAEMLLEIEAAGCNVEDTDQQSGRRRTPSEQAGFIAQLREHADDALIVNARIDSFLSASSAEAERAALPDAIERARAYLDAGAHCVYPIHVRSADVLEEFVAAVAPAPVNATYLPGGPDLTQPAGIGVARISLGGGLWQAARRWLADALAEVAAGKAPY